MLKENQQSTLTNFKKSKEKILNFAASTRTRENWPGIRKTLKACERPNMENISGFYNISEDVPILCKRAKFFLWS